MAAESEAGSMAGMNEHTEAPDAVIVGDSAGGAAADAAPAAPSAAPAAAASVEPTQTNAPAGAGASSSAQAPQSVMDGPPGKKLFLGQLSKQMSDDQVCSRRFACQQLCMKRRVPWRRADPRIVRAVWANRRLYSFEAP